VAARVADPPSRRRPGGVAGTELSRRYFVVIAGFPGFCQLAAYPIPAGRVNDCARRPVKWFCNRRISGAAGPPDGDRVRAGPVWTPLSSGTSRGGRRGARRFQLSGQAIHPAAGVAAGSWRSQFLAAGSGVSWEHRDHPVRFKAGFH